MPGTELIVSVSSPAEMDGTDLGPYDAVSLGNPYCRRIEGNYAERLDLLAEAAETLRGAGKKAYVTSPAAPRGRDLPHVERLIEAAARAGVHAVEIHNMGALRILREMGNPLPAHMGAYANVYTHLAARVMREYGAVRVRPNAEVSLKEMEILASEGGTEVEVLVHGKIPLGVTDRCSLLSEAEETDPNCPSACAKDHWLVGKGGGGEGGAPAPRGRDGRPGERHGGWVLKTVGKGVLSGRDMCMLEHLPALLSAGFSVFRIEGLHESPAYRSEIGRAYREAFESAASRGPAFRTGDEDGGAGSPAGNRLRPEWIDAVRRHARVGLCNGYYFGKTGLLYVGSVLQVDKRVL